VPASRWRDCVGEPCLQKDKPRNVVRWDNKAKPQSKWLQRGLEVLTKKREGWGPACLQLTHAPAINIGTINRSSLQLLLGRSVSGPLHSLPRSRSRPSASRGLSTSTGNLCTGRRRRSWRATCVRRRRYTFEAVPPQPVACPLGRRLIWLRCNPAAVLTPGTGKLSVSEQNARAPR
jgi:hypothetical protein